MNQSKFGAAPCNLAKAREKSRLQVEIGFGFPCHWMINWREIFKPITKRTIWNRAITFDSHLKTALSTEFLPCLASDVFCKHVNKNISFVHFDHS